MQNQDSNSVMFGGFFVRLAAYFVDVILIGIVLLVVKVPLWIAAIFHPHNMFQTSLIFHFSAADIFLYLLSVLYFVMLTYFSGSTIGKKIFHLKVVTSDGSKLTLINVIYRETIGRYLSTIILWIGYFLIGVDTEKRGLHDMLCDTRVIYDFEKKEPRFQNIQTHKEIKSETIIERVEDTEEVAEEAKEEVVTEATEEVAMETTIESTEEFAEVPIQEENGLTETSEKKYSAATYKYVKE